MTTLAHEDTAYTAPPGYTLTRRHVARSQKEGVEMWLRKEWPAEGRAAGHIVGGPNYDCWQHEDGSGECRHYRTTENIRTRNGLLIHSSQCWAAGFASCVGIPETVEVNGRQKKTKAVILPLTLLQTVAGREGVYGINKVVPRRTPFDPNSAGRYQGETEEEFAQRLADYKRRHEERQFERPDSALIYFDDGRVCYFGTDEGTPFAFFLTDEEKQRVKSPEKALLLLKPDLVKQAEKKGRRVMRQGEWWFIETLEGFEPPTRINSSPSLLGNHLPTFQAIGMSRHELLLRLYERAKPKIEEHNHAEWAKWRAYYEDSFAHAERELKDIRTYSEYLKGERNRLDYRTGGDMKKGYWYEKLVGAVRAFKFHVEKARNYMNGYSLMNRDKPDKLIEITAESLIDMTERQAFTGWHAIPFVDLKDIHEITNVYVRGQVRHAAGRIEHAPVRLAEEGSTSIAFDNTRWWMAVQHWRPGVISGGSRRRGAGAD